MDTIQCNCSCMNHCITHTFCSLFFFSILSIKLCPRSYNDDHFIDISPHLCPYTLWHQKVPGCSKQHNDLFSSTSTHQLFWRVPCCVSKHKCAWLHTDLWQQPRWTPSCLYGTQLANYLKSVMLQKHHHRPSCARTRPLCNPRLFLGSTQCSGTHSASIFWINFILPHVQ